MSKLIAWLLPPIPVPDVQDKERGFTNRDELRSAFVLPSVYNEASAFLVKRTI